MSSRRCRDSATSPDTVGDQREVTLEQLLEPLVPLVESTQHLLQHRGHLRLREGEDPRHQQAGAGAGLAGGYLLSGQVRLGDDAARVVPQDVGGPPEHR